MARRSSRQPDEVVARTEVVADPDRFKHLPPPVRREDLRTSQDVTAHPDEVGEADRERAWLLRTTGLPL